MRICRMTRTLWTQIRLEWPLAFSGATCLAFLLDGGMIFRLLPNPVWLALIFLWLFAAILVSALSVVRHAEHLALRLGEPYGTLLLTLSVTFIEVMSIAAIMLHGSQQSNPGPRHIVRRGYDHPQWHGWPVAAGGWLAPSRAAIQSP